MRRMFAGAGAAFVVAAGLMFAAPANAAAPAAPKASGIHIQSPSQVTDVSAQRRRYYRRYRYYRPYYRPYYYNPYPYYYRPYYGPGVYLGGPGFRFGFGF